MLGLCAQRSLSDFERWRGTKTLVHIQSDAGLTRFLSTIAPGRELTGRGALAAELWWRKADMITYTDYLAGVKAGQLAGVFEGWPSPPSPEALLRILRGSSHVVLAVAPDDQVVGFVTAISDGVLTAYISLLEVLKPHRRQGVGTQLIRRLLRKLDGLYLHCDPELQPFYESLGMRALGGMAIRNFPVLVSRLNVAPC